MFGSLLSVSVPCRFLSSLPRSPRLSGTSRSLRDDVRRGEWRERRGERWEVAERYTSLYARLTYGPSVLCSSRVALRVPLRSRLRRVRWGEIENEWVTRSEGTSERSTHRCALSLTVHPSVTRHSVRPLVPRLLTSFLVPTVWRVEDVRSRGGRTEHRPDENRRNDWDTSPTVPAVYRSLRSLPSLLTSLHSCRSLMLHSLRLVPLVRWG